MITYTIEKYAADGHEGAPEKEYIVAQGIRTLAEARAIVRRVIGVKRLLPSRKWAGISPTIEAYHDFPPSHPLAYGCGGVAIVRRIEP